MISRGGDDIERNGGSKGAVRDHDKRKDGGATYTYRASSRRAATSRWFSLAKIAFMLVGSIQIIVNTTNMTGVLGDSIFSLSMSSSHLKTSDNDVSNHALLLNYSLVQGTLLESIPSAIFLPHRFVHQDFHRLGLWKYNQRYTYPGYIEFIPKQEEEEAGTNIKNDDVSSTSANNNDMIHSAPSSYVYVHLHKCGGTSMVSADYPLFRTHNLYYPYRKHHKEDFERRVDGYIQKGRLPNDSVAIAEDGFSASPSHDHVLLFSFIRDPAIKFLSGVGQVLDGYPSATNTGTPPRWERAVSPFAEIFLGKDVHRHITDDAVLQLLHCILDKMHFLFEEGIDPNDEIMLQKRKMALNHNHDATRQTDYLDLHLLPQVFDLYAGIQETPDVPVVLMDLKHLDTWFQNSHAIPPTRKFRSHTQNNAVETEEDASSTNNRRQLKHNLLPKLSPEEIYQKDPLLLERVCDVYSMDLAMLELLKTMGGLSVSTLCATE